MTRPPTGRQPRVAWCPTRALLLPLLLAAGVQPAVGQDRLRISGYGNAHFMNHDGTPTLVGSTPMDRSFVQLREFSLYFDFAITDRMLASVEFEAGDNGNRYTANYAYLDYQVSDQLSFRAGKILVPFLSYNENKPNFRQYLMSQPFTAWTVAPVVSVPLEFHGIGWSDVGVMVDWTVETGTAGLLNLKAALTNGLGSESDVLDDNTVQLDAGMMQPVVRPRDGLIQNEETVELRDNNSDKATVVKVSFRPAGAPLQLGFSWYRGDWDEASSRSLQMYGVHLDLLAQRFGLRGEWVLADVEQDAGIDIVAAAGLVGPAAINTSTGNYQMQAWYVEGSVVPAIWRRDGLWRIVARYDEVDPNDQAGFTPFDRRRVTVGTEIQLAASTRLRYEWQRATLRDWANAPAPYVAAGGKEAIQMHMPSVIFSF